MPRKKQVSVGFGIVLMFAALVLGVGTGVARAKIAGTHTVASASAPAPSQATSPADNSATPVDAHCPPGHPACGDHCCPERHVCCYNPSEGYHCEPNHCD